MPEPKRMIMKLIIVFVIALFISCSSNSSKTLAEIHLGQMQAKFKADGGLSLGNIYTVIIDSCEYIYVSYGNASWGSHKGNCKYCAMRAGKFSADSLK
jgi:hypothetical protein